MLSPDQSEDLNVWINLGFKFLPSNKNGTNIVLFRTFHDKLAVMDHSMVVVALMQSWFV